MSDFPRNIRIFILLFSLLLIPHLEAQETSGQFFILKIYKLDTLSQPTLMDNYLKKMVLPALNRQGIRAVGVFKDGPGKIDSVHHRYVLFPVPSLQILDMINLNLEMNQENSTAYSDHLEATGNLPPFKRVETIILKGFKEMPHIRPSEVKGDRKNRIYELRSYESPTETLFRNKVHMFNEGGEVALFDRLGFNAVFYGEVLAGSRMPNLMYMTTFKDMEARDSLWKAFFDSPEWKALINDPFYANNVNKVDIFFLTPTSYSAY